MSTYKAFQVTGSRNFELVTRERRAPVVGEVRIAIESCGVCHSDVLAVEGLRADPGSPIVPGHELVGVIEAVGDGVHAWQVGDRVGVGYLGGHCGECEYCRRGDFVNCANQPQTGTRRSATRAPPAWSGSPTGCPRWRRPRCSARA